MVFEEKVDLTLNLKKIVCQSNIINRFPADMSLKV